LHPKGAGEHAPRWPVAFGDAHFTPSGSTLTVSNDGLLPHTLAAVDGPFDTGFLDPGATAELTIDEPGVHQVLLAPRHPAG